MMLSAVTLLAQAGVDPVGLSSDSSAAVQALDLDLSRGPISDLCTQTSAIALKMFLVLGLIALIIEAFGRGAASPRDYSGLAWRAVVVLLLLKFYAPIFGTVINTTQALEPEFKPMEANEELSRQTATYLASGQGTTPTTASDLGSGSTPSWIGTKVYEASI